MPAPVKKFRLRFVIEKNIDSILLTDINTAFTELFK